MGATKKTFKEDLELVLKKNSETLRSLRNLFFNRITAKKELSDVFSEKQIKTWNEIDSLLIQVSRRIEELK